MDGERFCYTGGRAGLSPVAEFPFKQFMVTIAKGAVLSELEAQWEQELAEARAIQLGMLPHGPLRTEDVSVCYEFQPFHEVGDFLDFFTLTDGTIGIDLGDVTGKRLPAAVLRTVNRRVILRGVSPRYAAVQYGCLDPRTGIPQIASAGMSGPLILSERGYREMELRTPPGMFPETSYKRCASLCAKMLPKRLWQR